MVAGLPQERSPPSAAALSVRNPLLIALGHQSTPAPSKHKTFGQVRGEALFLCK